MQFWWVNQGSRFAEERELACLWAPKRSKDGRNVGHWESLTQVQPDDVVFHNQHGVLRAWSRVLTAAQSAPQPTTSADYLNWDGTDGYRIELDITNLDPPIACQDIPEALRTGTSVFTQLGKPKQGYLFPVEHELGQYLADKIPTLSARATVSSQSSMQSWQSTLADWRQQHGPLVAPPDVVALRDQFTQKFPKETLDQMQIEDYVLGNDNPTGFSRQLEFGTKKLGSISGGSSLKHGVYWNRHQGSYEWKSRFETADEAFTQIRLGFVKLIRAVEDDCFEELDRIADEYLGVNNNVLRVKPLYLYYPERFIPIFSVRELDHFLDFFDLPKPSGTIAKNLTLFHYLRDRPEFAGFDSWGMMRFLYDHKAVFSKPSDAQNSEANTWIFQGNPALFDLRSALRELPRLSWLVKQHREAIRAGDRVFFWESGQQGGLLASGTIESDPAELANDEESGEFYKEAADFDSSQPRVWVELDRVLQQPISRDRLNRLPELEDLSILNYWQGTNFPVQPDEAAMLEQLIVESNVPPVAPNPTYTWEQLAADTLAGTDQLRRLVRTLERKQQIILSGVPGSGKTHLATHLARYLVSDSDGCIETIQFHPAYTYEDFIQGLRPLADRNGNLSYRVVPGRFLEFCQQARDRRGNSVLIIDEINRANLSAVFGELMYLLEYRDREIQLAGSNRPFSIPHNLYIIGTMNTADRSIALVDWALRRRFAFIELRPNYEILRQWHAREQTDVDVTGLIQILEQINRVIDDPHYEIGVSFFLDRDLRDHLQDIWELEILPYLTELLYDASDKVEQFTWANVRDQLLPPARVEL